MAYSAWKIWLHPEVTGRLMAELEAENESRRNREETLTKTLSEAESARESLLAEADKLREEIDLLKSELAERREAAELYGEVEENMKRVGEMKAKYEKRIARLREEIIRLKTASGRKGPEAGELGEIDMLGEAIDPIAGRESQMSGQDRTTGNDGEWLELL